MEASQFSMKTVLMNGNLFENKYVAYNEIKAQSPFGNMMTVYPFEILSLIIFINSLLFNFNLLTFFLFFRVLFENFS